MQRCHTYNIAWSIYSKSNAGILQKNRGGADVNQELKALFNLKNEEEKTVGAGVERGFRGRRGGVKQELQVWYNSKNKYKNGGFGLV